MNKKCLMSSALCNHPTFNDLQQKKSLQIQSSCSRKGDMVALHLLHHFSLHGSRVFLFCVIA